MKEIAFVSMAVLAIVGWIAFCCTHFLLKETIERWKRDCEKLEKAKIDRSQL